MIEAEHSASKIARNGKDWVEEIAIAGYSGAGYMTASPNTGIGYNTGYVTGSPEMVYHIDFTTPGTYNVWIRGYGATGSDDSVHAGIDGAGPTSADRLNFWPNAQWIWTRNTMDSAPAWT